MLYILIKGIITINHSLILIDYIITNLPVAVCKSEVVDNLISDHYYSQRLSFYELQHDKSLILKFHQKGNLQITIF